MSTTSCKHGDRQYVCGTKCRFVSSWGDGELDKYLVDTGQEATGCCVCPANGTPECGNTSCFGGYWVPEPLFNVLRLRGMPGGDDGS